MKPRDAIVFIVDRTQWLFNSEQWPADVRDGLDAALAVLSDAAACEQYLDPGRMYDAEGEEVPTTLTQRAKNMRMALSAETEEVNRLAELVQHYRWGGSYE